MDRHDPAPPPAAVLHAFGVDDQPRRLPGGQETSWVAGGVVLKPDADAVHEWFASVAPTIVPEGFRLAAPLRSRFDTWSVEGWSATPWVAGREPDLSDVRSLGAVVSAGRAFHRACAHLPRPRVLADRRDRWARADAAAWGEHDLDVGPEWADLARRLRPLLRPLGEPQVVHGDLTLNVLVEPGLDPAVIDVSPYWRPSAYAEGVVVADALCWHDGDRSLVDRLGVPVTAVARALLFRLLTSALAQEETGDPATDELERYEHAAVVLGVQPGERP